MMPRSLELSLARGRSVFGEVREAEGSHGSALLLHDAGEDLDSVRPFASPLHTLGLTTVLLDMPGHGLSDGEWDRDAPRAVRRALDVCRNLHSNVGVVAVGAACSVLYGLHPAPVRVSALVSPRFTADDLAGSAAWRIVPVITMGDPCDARTSASLAGISRWIRAWSLCLSVHYLDPPGGGPRSWTPQMTYSSAAFIAEQIAYAERGRGAEPPSVPVPTTEMAAPTGLDDASPSRGMR